MAETAGSLVTALGNRIRDPNSTAHPSASVITLLSYCQQVIGAATGALKITSSLTLPALAPHNITDLSFSFIQHVRVERVLYQNRDLEQTPWQSFAHHRPDWVRASGAQPLMWDMIGRLVVVTPTVLDRTETVSLIGTKLTATLAASGNAIELPDAHVPAILALAEQLLLLRHRLLTSVKPAVEQLQRMLPTGVP